MNGAKKVVRGISFGAVCNSDERLLDRITQDYECLEIPALELKKMDHIVERCRKNGIGYAIHYPSGYSVSHIEFDVMDPEKREHVLRDFEGYVNRYGDAVYYVLHFPNGGLKNSAADDYAHALSEIYKRFPNQREKLVIENLSYLSAKEYKEICGRVGAGLCLDIGHSHLMGEEDLEDYFSDPEDRIRVIHYYNTSRNPHNVYYGRHVDFSFDVPQGIDREKIDRMISGLGNKVYIINETDSKYYFKWRNG